MPKRKPKSKSGKPKPSRVGRPVLQLSSAPRTTGKTSPEVEPLPVKPSEDRVSKQAKVIAMLRNPRGTSISTISAATGWQEHSVRGFFAAVVKKRFGLSLVSEKAGSERVYRIETDPASDD
jgi:Protein of unknown function (DUF3489)